MMKKQVDVVIVGAGLSGLSAANFLKNRQPDLSLCVLEKSERPGGAILTHSEDGYLAEWGAHGFLDNCKESRTLIQLAGLENEVEKAPLGKFVRYICLGGRLNLIPQNPKKILFSDLVPFFAKLRVLADIWKKPLAGEPSVSAWIEYRFGKALLPFADAVFTGTYAGDIDRLKIDAVMPGIRKLEMDKGSVIRSLLEKMKEKKKKEGQEGPSLPAMTSFKAGMAALPRALAGNFAPVGELMCRAEVDRIHPVENGWEVETGQQGIQCRHLVLALPVNHSLALLGRTGETGTPPMSSVPEARIATVALGFTDQVKIPFGFGYLAPERENRFALGTLFSSHMFPGRAPRGHVLVEVLVGGRRHPERLEIDDAEMVDRVFEDVSGLLDLPERPCFSRVMRPRAGIPQLEEGYPDLLAWKDRIQDRHRGLHICGFGWNGIGINDMTKEAWKAADSILHDAGGRGGEAEVKGVYF